VVKGAYFQKKVEYPFKANIWSVNHLREGMTSAALWIYPLAWKISQVNPEEIVLTCQTNKDAEIICFYKLDESKYHFCCYGNKAYLI